MGRFRLSYLDGTGQAMAMFKKGVDEAEVRDRLQRAAKQNVRVKVSREPVVRLKAKTAGMSVVKTLWQRSGKGMVWENEMTRRVWTVMTRKRVYEVKLEEVSEGKSGNRPVIIS